MGMVMRSDGDCSSDTGWMDLLRQRGTLRRLVAEALADKHVVDNPDWQARARHALAQRNWAVYEMDPPASTTCTHSLAGDRSGQSEQT